VRLAICLSFSARSFWLSNVLYKAADFKKDRLATSCAKIRQFRHRVTRYKKVLEQIQTYLHKFEVPLHIVLKLLHVLRSEQRIIEKLYAQLFLNRLGE